VGDLAKRTLDNDTHAFDDRLVEFKKSVNNKEIDLELVILTLGQLGLPEGGNLEQIRERALKLGLEFCPAPTGHELRRQFDEQREGDWFYIAMDTIPASEGDPRVFCAARLIDGHWLITDWYNPGSPWHVDSRFVFLRRK